MTDGTVRRVRKNVRWLCCDRGWESRDLAGAMMVHTDWRDSDSGRKVRRYVNGHQRMTLDALEAIAYVLGVPPGVLAYGSLDEVQEAASRRNRPAVTTEPAW